MAAPLKGGQLAAQGSAKAVSDRAGAPCPGSSLLTIRHHSGTTLLSSLSFPFRLRPSLLLVTVESFPTVASWAPSLLSTVQVTGHSFKSNQLPNRASLCTGCFRIRFVPESVVRGLVSSDLIRQFVETRVVARALRVDGHKHQSADVIIIYHIYSYRCISVVYLLLLSHKIYTVPCKKFFAICI